MGGFPHAPGSLVVFGITCTAVGVLVLVVLGWHAARRLLDVPRVPRGAGSYALWVVACAALLGAGIVSLCIAASLDDWPSAPGPAPLAEVRCQRLSPSTARLSFVPLSASGGRGPEEVETVESCSLALQRLRFSSSLARFGLVERQRLARVGSRLRPLDTPEWRALPRPLGAPVAQAATQDLAVPAPDDQPYRVLSDDKGLRLEKVER
jgi:hypothetical protein